MRLGMGLAAAAVFAAVIGASCLGATQITLDVRTDLDCTKVSEWRGVSVSVGQPGVDVEGRAPVLTTTKCTGAGEVGTLVIVPTGTETAEVGIEVVAGITRNPDECSAHGYDGCIVARRTLTYLPHQSQQVVVDLTNDCLGNACDAYHTCVNGTCSDTASVTSTTKVDSSTPSGPRVRCGDDGTTCPVNDPSSVCCVDFDLDAGTGSGTCIAAEQCPSTKATLYCDDPSDCGKGDGGMQLICCQTFDDRNHAATGSCVTEIECLNAGHVSGNSFCEDRQPCPFTGQPCTPSTDAPGYFTCDPYDPNP